MKIKKIILSILIFLFVQESLASNVTQVTSCAGKEIVGKSENVLILNNNLLLPAKLDTGASMSSLSAIDIHAFRRNDKTWLQFIVNVPSMDKKIMFSSPLIGYVQILKRQEEIIQNTQQSDSKQYEVRPTIMLTVCIGHQIQDILVNLIDRRNFDYPMLIGSDALKKFNFLVDVSKKNMIAPRCIKNNKTLEIFDIK